MATQQPRWTDRDIATLRLDMMIKDYRAKFPNVKFVTSAEMPLTTKPGELHIHWLHENMIQVGRAWSHLAIGTYSYNEMLSKMAGEGCNVITHNYVHTARLIQRWRYEAEYPAKSGKMHPHLGWNVFYLGNDDPTTFNLNERQQHPMMAGLHGVAANNRKWPMSWGDSKVFSLSATPKYALIAAALKGVPVLIECPDHWDWRAVVTKGFQSELRVLSGEWQPAERSELDLLTANSF